MREIAVREAGLDDVFIDDITFPAVDGYALGATLFLPLGAKQHARRCGHDDHRRSRLLQARTSRHALARRGRVAGGGGIAVTVRCVLPYSDVKTAWVRFRASWFKLALYLFFSSNAA